MENRSAHASLTLCLGCTERQEAPLGEGKEMQEDSIHISVHCLFVGCLGLLLLCRDSVATATRNKESI